MEIKELYTFVGKPIGYNDQGSQCIIVHINGQTAEAFGSINSKAISSTDSMTVEIVAWGTVWKDC